MHKEGMTNSRTKQIWLPGLVSLAGSMGWMMVLQKIVLPLQMPFKHAGVPILPYFLWAVTLPFIGVASGYVSHRARSSRRSGLVAVLFPSILMAPIWLLILFASHHPTQWENFCFGVLFWVIVPGVALLAGAWPFLKTRGLNADEPINFRTKTFWLPALASLTASMVVLMISTLIGLNPFFLARGLSNQVVYLPWLFVLPLCGATGAYLSRRAGGRRTIRLVTGLFPAIAMLVLGSFLVLTRVIIFTQPQALRAVIAFIIGVILPATALLIGTLPFMRQLTVGGEPCLTGTN